MKNTRNISDAKLLRKKAEELMNKKPLRSSPKLAEADALKLIHELEVHQIELEILNEELTGAKKQAEIGAVKYFELYNFAPTGYFILSHEGEILDLNLSGSKMLGKERSHLKNSSFGFFISDDTKPIFNLFLDNAFRSKSKETCEVTLSTNNNLPIHVLLTGIVVKDGNQCDLTIVDISERKQNEAEIKFKNEQLLKLAAEKDKFFSLIAHDLRNTLSSFQGLSQIMALQLPDLQMDKLQKIADMMKDSSANLYRLLENLLQWASSKQGLIPFNPKSVHLRPILKENIEIVLDSAKSKEIQIDFNIPEDLVVYADTNILNTIFRNLISNALKFTHKGGKISISAKIIEDENVEIAIMDTGIGMSSTMVNELFRLDVKSNRKGTEGEPTTGIGLLLCKEFIEKNGGKLWVESEEGKGSTFYFTLPHLALLKLN